jgi:hypothetical protein
MGTVEIYSHSVGLVDDKSSSLSMYLHDGLGLIYCSPCAKQTPCLHNPFCHSRQILVLNICNLTDNLVVTLGESTSLPVSAPSRHLELQSFLLKLLSWTTCIDLRWRIITCRISFCTHCYLYGVVRSEGCTPLPLHVLGVRASKRCCSVMECAEEAQNSSHTPMWMIK